MFRNRLKRSDPVLEEVLDRHAEALVAGEDQSEEILREYGAAYPALAELLPLAGRLEGALKPVEPSEQFVARLKARLIEEHVRQVRAWAPQPDRLLRVSRILGVIISALTILALLVRIASSIFMLVMILTERRRRSTVAV